MMGSGGSAAAGGPVRHTPVLGRRTVDWLGVRDGGFYVDATFGAGGYTRAIWEAGARVIGIDRDRARSPKARILSRKLRAVSTWLRIASQTWKPSSAPAPPMASFSISAFLRCSSTRRRADFRSGSMGRSTCGWEELARARPMSSPTRASATCGHHRHFGRRAFRAADSAHFVKARGESAIVTTRALAELVARVVHAGASAIHPATRTFQALRIFVNDELGELARASSPPNVCSSRMDASSSLPSIHSRIVSSKILLPSAAVRRPALAIGPSRWRWHRRFTP